jgi:hypothetical protein
LLLESSGVGVDAVRRQGTDEGRRRRARGERLGSARAASAALGRRVAAAVLEAELELEVLGLDAARREHRAQLGCVVLQHGERARALDVELGAQLAAREVQADLDATQALGRSSSTALSRPVESCSRTWRRISSARASCAGASRGVGAAARTSRAAGALVSRDSAGA